MLAIQQETLLRDQENSKQAWNPWLNLLTTRQAGYNCARKNFVFEFVKDVYGVSTDHSRSDQKPGGVDDPKF